MYTIKHINKKKWTIKLNFETLYIVDDNVYNFL